MCASRTVSSPPSPSPTVAVVDDDAAARRALGRILRAHDLRVASFASAEELLQAYDATLPSCLVLDVVLPGMSGPDLLERLRSAPGCPPAVFVTGRIDAAQTLRLRGMEQVPCLQKPFEPALLVTTVRRALELLQPNHA
jgi:FixJ family two-component response regulator